ncbi:MAG: prenyltransferase/squalene oxidase repeat-containing protein [Isosphaeraceae bacterium]
MPRLAHAAAVAAAVALLVALTVRVEGAVTREQVETAIRNGVRYLKEQQRADGSWVDLSEETPSGVTSLVTLALLTAGEPPNEPHVAKALDYLRGMTPERLGNTYSVGLQTMVFAAATPERDQLKIAANVAWLERAQIKPGERVNWAGSWTYTEFKTRFGDNSNTQYALLGLNAAAEVGVPVKPEVWTLARRYWEQQQHNDGSWAYTPDARTASTASMTCAGISSLVIAGLKRFQGQEYLSGSEIRDCGKGNVNVHLQRATDWLARNFYVGQNVPSGQQFKYYYLYGLERAGRLTGQRFFGSHDWYREGAQELVIRQDKIDGFWEGSQPYENNRDVTTSCSLPRKGRAPCSSTSSATARRVTGTTTRTTYGISST